MATAPPPWAQDVDDGANDALLDDLIAFLDDTPTTLAGGETSLGSHSDEGNVGYLTSITSSVVVSPRTPPAPVLIPLGSKRRRSASVYQGCPIKRTLDALRDEAEQLTESLHRLHIEASRKCQSRAAETALAERYKRRRAERECEQLRDAVYAQARFLKGLQSVFSTLPSLTPGLNLCRHLHHYTRLPREKSVRWNEYAALSAETRLQRAMDILLRETQALTCNEADRMDTTRPPLSLTVDVPIVHIDVTNDADSFAVTTTSVYALDTLDMGAVVRGACVAVRDIVVRWCSSYQCTNVKGLIVDPEASSSSANNILYRVMGIHTKSLGDESDELSIESRLVTLYKETDDYAVVLWDYIDDDELHPATDADMNRQAIGACHIRREMCDDGVERTVLRILNTRQFRFHEHAMRDKLYRFKHFSIATNRENELLFRDIVVDSIAKEEAAYARVAGTM